MRVVGYRCIGWVHRKAVNSGLVGHLASVNIVLRYRIGRGVDPDLVKAEDAVTVRVGGARAG